MRSICKKDLRLYILKRQISSWKVQKIPRKEIERAIDIMNMYFNAKKK